jgi:L-aminopeptidase/D-esterase-like protein
VFGLARTGSSAWNGSGDYGIAYSTARNLAKLLSNDEMSRLFLAVIETTHRQWTHGRGDSDRQDNRDPRNALFRKWRVSRDV